MTKSFRETMKENNAKFKQGMEANKEKTRLESANLKSEYKEKQQTNKVQLAEAKANQPKGFGRTGNILVKGFALWLAIPAIVVILLIVLFAGVGLWDWVIGLFS